MKFPDVVNRSVIVTGCSSGIGEATAHVLRDRGWLVIPTARKAEDLDALKSAGFSPVEIDLTDSSSVKKAVDQALEISGGKLGAVVNNAGFGQPGAVEDLSRKALRGQFEVNLFGLQELTNLLIPEFRKQGYGRIVNVSSVLGRVSAPMIGAYCSSKFALEALSDALRMEMRPAGIAVSIIEPGPIVTAFRKRLGVQIDEELDSSKALHGELYEQEAVRRKNQKKKVKGFTRPPEDVAVKIAHALESSHPKRRYCVTIPAYFGAFVRRVLPHAVLDWSMASKVPKVG